jgi:hypothetical protein
MYRGVVYDCSKAPVDEHYVLTPSQLRALAATLVGKPIRIEHKDRTVGTVKNAHFDEKVLAVEWDLQNDHVGWASEHLIETGRSPELSMKHVRYSNGAVEPIEISLVQKGARAGCTIQTQQYNQEQDKTVNKTPEVVVMASAGGEAPTAPGSVPASPVATPASPVADVAVPPIASAPAPSDAAAAPAPVAGSDDEPASKKQKLEDPVSFLQNLQTRISDTETLQAVADYIAAQMEVNVNKTNEITALNEAKRLLEAAQKAHVDSSKNVVKDIVETLSSLYQQYANSTILNDVHKEKLTNLLSQDPVAMDALRPLVVAASAINMRAGATLATASGKVLDGAFARLQTLQKQLDAARGMSSAPAPSAPAAAAAPVAVAMPSALVQPNWTAAAPPASAAVEVAASAGAAQAAPSFKLPDIFKMSVPSFNESGGVGRVLPRDLRMKM